MDILLATHDLIENTQVDCQNINDFLRMAQEYQNQILMDELREELNS